MDSWHDQKIIFTRPCRLWSLLCTKSTHNGSMALQIPCMCVVCKKIVILGEWCVTSDSQSSCTKNLCHFCEPQIAAQSSKCFHMLVAIRGLPACEIKSTFWGQKWFSQQLSDFAYRTAHNLASSVCRCIVIFETVRLCSWRYIVLSCTCSQLHKWLLLRLGNGGLLQLIQPRGASGYPERGIQKEG